MFGISFEALQPLNLISLNVNSKMLEKFLKQLTEHSVNSSTQLDSSDSSDSQNSSDFSDSSTAMKSTVRCTETHHVRSCESFKFSEPTELNGSKSDNRSISCFPIPFSFPFFSPSFSSFLQPIIFRALYFTLFLSILIPILIAIRLSPLIPPKWDASHLSFSTPTHKRLSVPYEPEDTTVQGMSHTGVFLNSSISQLLHEEPHNYFKVVLETHTHTTHSDGMLSPQQLVDWAILYGFNVLFVTDHNTVEGGLEAEKYALQHYKDEILVIPGVEYTCCRTHLNLVGIRDSIIPSSSFPSDEELRSVIKRTKTHQGFVTANHIPWSASLEHGRQQPRMQEHPEFQQLLDMGIDAVEAVSEGVFDFPGFLQAGDAGIPAMGATDLHMPQDIPRAWTVIAFPREKLTGVLPTAEELFFVLRTTPWLATVYYDPVGPTPGSGIKNAPYVRYPRINPSYRKWEPLIALDFTFLWSDERGMYSFLGDFCHERHFQVNLVESMWLVVWCLMVFLAYEAGRFATQRVARQFKRYKGTY